MRKYILKEYGSWGVMVISYLSGILAGGGFGFEALLSFMALSLFINSKQAFTLWIRRVDSTQSAVVFIAQIAIASLMMIGILGEAVMKLLPHVLIPVSYIVLLYLAGEHAIVTEICGFALLTLSSLIAKFVVSGMLDYRLYIAVAIFFIAGVFKVKLQLKRRAPERVLMILYSAFAVFAYHLIQMPAIILLPLIDNVISSFTLYRLKLKATGWLEVLKGIVFLVLVSVFSQ